AQQQPRRLEAIAAPLRGLDSRGEQGRMIGDQIEGPLEPPGGLLWVRRGEQRSLGAQGLGTLRGGDEQLLLALVERDGAIDESDPREEAARRFQVGPERGIEPE